MNKPNGILKASTARKIADMNTPRVIAVNPDVEPIQTSEDSDFITPTSPEIPVSRSKENLGVPAYKTRKFLGFLDAAGNPDSDVFVRAGTHDKCDGPIYQSKHDAIGIYLECAKCGAWGTVSSVTSKNIPASLRNSVGRISPKRRGRNRHTAP